MKFSLLKGRQHSKHNLISNFKKFLTKPINLAVSLIATVLMPVSMAQEVFDYAALEYRVKQQMVDVIASYDI